MIILIVTWISSELRISKLICMLHRTNFYFIASLYWIISWRFTPFRASLNISEEN